MVYSLISVVSTTVHPRRSIRVNLLSVTEEHVDRSRPVGKDGRGASNFISSNFLYKAITLMKFREMFMGLNEGPQSVYWTFTLQPVWLVLLITSRGRDVCVVGGSDIRRKWTSQCEQCCENKPMNTGFCARVKVIFRELMWSNICS